MNVFSEKLECIVKIDHFLGQWACVYKLLLFGANASGQNEKGFTPLHLAIEKIDSLGYKKDPAYLNYTRVIEILLQSNADRHLKSLIGKSPMDLVQDQGN